MWMKVATWVILNTSIKLFLQKRTVLHYLHWIPKFFLDSNKVFDTIIGNRFMQVGFIIVKGVLLSVGSWDREVAPARNATTLFQTGDGLPIAGFHLGSLRL